MSLFAEGVISGTLFAMQATQIQWPTHQFIVFLDDLFLNVTVAHVLLSVGIAVMGPTRKNTEEVLLPLIKLKMSMRSA